MVANDKFENKPNIRQVKIFYRYLLRTYCLILLHVGTSTNLT